MTAMSGSLSWRGWWTVSDDVVDRLRLVNPYSGAQVLGVCRDAAAEMERLRHEMGRLNAALDDISHLTADYQVQHRIREARRG
jgi:hypothetical protein